MTRLLFAICLFGQLLLPSFTFLHSGWTGKKACSSVLSALTERQMQFWEDVEEGLDDIENFYAKKGQDIDRIRQFGKRCVSCDPCSHFSASVYFLSVQSTLQSNNTGVY